MDQGLVGMGIESLLSWRPILCQLQGDVLDSTVTRKMTGGLLVGYKPSGPSTGKDVVK